MSLWRKIVNVFVETEEEVIEEQPKAEPVVRESVRVKPETVKEAVKKEPVKQESVKTEPVKEEKKSIFINEKKPSATTSTTASPKETTVKPEVKKVVNGTAVPQTTTKNGYEFRPVISPMFGVNETEVITKPVTNIQTSPVHNSSVLGTIVSPIYGLAQKEDIPEVIKEEVQEEDIQNFSLDDLVEEKTVREDRKEPEEDFPYTESIHLNQLGASKVTDKEVIQEMKEELSYDKEPTIQDILTEKAPVKQEKEEAVNDPTIAEGQLSLDFESRTEEIRKAMEEFKEEDYFEKEKQPSLFDLKDE